MNDSVEFASLNWLLLCICYKITNYWIIDIDWITLIYGWFSFLYICFFGFTQSISSPRPRQRSIPGQLTTAKPRDLHLKINYSNRWNWARVIRYLKPAWPFALRTFALRTFALRRFATRAFVWRTFARRTFAWGTFVIGVLLNVSEKHTHIKRPFQTSNTIHVCRERKCKIVSSSR